MIPGLAQPARRAVLLQLLFACAVLFVVGYLIDNAAENLVDLGIASGFGFLRREAGFAIGETTWIPYNPADTYLRAIAVGVLNTVRVAALAMIGATLLGILVGLSRLSANWLLAKLAAAYVEVLRNIPLVVQLFFWYAVITESLPGPGEAFHPADGIFLSNRGLAFPSLKLSVLHWWLVVGLGAVLILTFSFLRRGRTIAAATASLAVIAGAWWIPLEVDFPEFAGFNFSGGAMLSPEFTALFFGLALYTAAFIAEIVRAGILSVERGQIESAYSLGLNRRQVMRFIVAPQALRMVVPPLTSQFLNCTKNSSLAVAIGYPDLVSVVNTTINQTGQAIEGIAIIILVYLTVSLGISLLMNWYNRRVALRGNSA